jgi:hypothetical protein
LARPYSLNNFWKSESFFCKSFFLYARDLHGEIIKNEFSVVTRLGSTRLLQVIAQHSDCKASIDYQCTIPIVFPFRQKNLVTHESLIKVLSFHGPFPHFPLLLYGKVIANIHPQMLLLGNDINKSLPTNTVFNPNQHRRNRYILSIVSIAHFCFRGSKSISFHSIFLYSLTKNSGKYLFQTIRRAMHFRVRI